MRLVLAAALPVLLAACGHAPPKTPAPPAAAATVSPAAAGVGYFAGAWTARARDPGTGVEVVVDYRVEPAPGGTWLTGTAEGPDVRATDVWGRDPATGGIMRAIFDSSGVYALVRGAVLRVRETIRRQGPDAFEAVWEAFRDGAWVTYSIEQVTRRRDA